MCIVTATIVVALHVILFLHNNYVILHLSADDIFSMPDADVWINVRLYIYISILVYEYY